MHLVGFIIRICFVKVVRANLVILNRNNMEHVPPLTRVCTLLKLHFNLHGLKN
jgi:hypothetical protein